MLTPFEVALFFGAIGAALLLASNLMKRMIPLRVLALGSNLFFIVQASIDRNWLHLVLQISLLVVNSYRLWDLWRLGKAIDRANANTPLKDWLLPHMKRRKFTAGTTIFNKGDRANELIYIRSGRVRIVEVGQTMGEGNLIGEIGLFTETRERTASIVCETDCVCYTMTDEAIHLLYYQNPKLGFFLIRLIVQRLVKDLQRRPDTAPA